ncbi:hypothetical protein RB195_008400 [Necator americanus]|uniref:Uncharacterized protein n=1 Tax=Necator americanus TaxID=51031 RepID=A0ABR1CQB7_NECAM
MRAASRSRSQRSTPWSSSTSVYPTVTSSTFFWEPDNLRKRLYATSSATSATYSHTSAGHEAMIPIDRSMYSRSEPSPTADIYNS